MRQAQLEESIFTILEEQGPSDRSRLPMHSLEDKELTIGILAECLHWCGLESTAKVRIGSQTQPFARYTVLEDSHTHMSRHASLSTGSCH